MIRRQKDQIVVNGLPVQHRRINPMVDPTLFEVTMTLRATGSDLDAALASFEKLTVLMARDVLKFAGQSTLDRTTDTEVDR